MAESVNRNAFFCLSRIVFFPIAAMLAANQAKPKPAVKRKIPTKWRFLITSLVRTGRSVIYFDRCIVSPGLGALL